jgi:hypothetical protein
MRIFSVFFFTFLFNISFVEAFQNAKVKVSGTILSAESQEVIVGASVSWNEGKDGVVANVNGKFSFDIEPGFYTLTISAVGKKNIKRDIKISKDLDLEFRLKDDVQQLSEVTVKSNGEVSNLKSASMGIERMSIKSIRQVPPMMGEVDVIKSIITLPGISSIGEGSGGINVRGGSVGQNLVREIAFKVSLKQRVIVQ